MSIYQTRPSTIRGPPEVGVLLRVPSELVQGFFSPGSVVETAQAFSQEILCSSKVLLRARVPRDGVKAA